MRDSKLGRYLKKKDRVLSPDETQKIRERIEKGEKDVYKLAEEFQCVPTQVAGIKARMKF